MGNKYAGNKGLEYYKAYPRDFFEGTIGMAGPLRGFYRMVIDLIYMHDGFLLNDWGHISGNTGFGKTQCKRMMQQLVDSDKIQLSGENDEFFTQNRAKSELKASRKFQETQANKVAKRWKNNNLPDTTAIPEGIPDGYHHKTTRPQDLFHSEIEGENLDEKSKAKPKSVGKRFSTFSANKEVLDILGKYASPDAATSFVAYRTKIRKPITVTAASRMAKQLELVLNGGGDPDDALGMCEERGWQGVKAEWYFNSKSQEQGQDHGQSNNNGQQSKYSRGSQGYPNGASGAHAGLIAGLADNADRYARGEGSDDHDDAIPI